MYKVYLVDDEEIVLKELLVLIDWNELGFEICGYQTNPTMVIDELIELQPDIVILDIHMMRLNGLELARQIYNLKNDIIIYFLSAYDKFDYAQQAIEIGAKAYFTKPIKKQELIKVLKKSKRSLDRAFLDNLLNSFIHTDNLVISEDLLNELNKRIRFSNETFIICTKPSTYFENLYKDDIIYEYQDNFIKIIITNNKVNFQTEDLIISSAFETTSDFLIQLRLTYQSFVQSQNNPDKGSETAIKSVINSILDDIHQNFDKKLYLSMYAEKYNYTVSYLSILFKQNVGCPFIEYLVKYRMEQAKHYIKAGTMTMKEVSYSVGYNDYYQFSKIFKKYVGYSPRVYANLKNK